MLVVMEVIDARSIEGAGSANQSVDLIALLQQLLGHVGAILPGDPGDEGPLTLCHVNPPKCSDRQWNPTRANLPEW